ncbi:MAG: hypothetical protein O3A46_02380 [Candidatus Poribacteria bacterium]|nr:hypothetical protein [Candidatus Poribacteria bacterium]
MASILDLDERQRLLKKYAMNLIRLSRGLPISESTRILFKELVMEALIWGVEVIKYEGFRDETLAKVCEEGMCEGYHWLLVQRIHAVDARRYDEPSVRAAISDATYAELRHGYDNLLAVVTITAPLSLPFRNAAHGLGALDETLRALGGDEERLWSAIALKSLWDATHLPDEREPTPLELERVFDPFKDDTERSAFIGWNASAQKYLAQRFDQEVLGVYPSL